MTLDDALDQALAENDLGEEHRDEVREMVRADRATWRPCCGMLCDPCVLALHRAADRARRLCDDGA